MTLALRVPRSLRIFAVIAAGLILLPVAASAERARGTAGSRDREAWCTSGAATCIDNAYKECDRQFPTDAAAAGNCYRGAFDTCEAQWGEGSNCRTQERVAPQRPLPRPRVNPTR